MKTAEPPEAMQDHHCSSMPFSLKIISINADGGEAIRVHPCPLVVLVFDKKGIHHALSVLSAYRP
jgi:hypothetical protein